MGLSTSKVYEVPAPSLEPTEKTVDHRLVKATVGKAIGHRGHVPSRQKEYFIFLWADGINYERW